jgi:hypothetical protein
MELAVGFDFLQLLAHLRNLHREQLFNVLDFLTESPPRESGKSVYDSAEGAEDKKDNLKNLFVHGV